MEWLISIIIGVLGSQISDLISATPASKKLKARISGVNSKSNNDSGNQVKDVENNGKSKAPNNEPVQNVRTMESKSKSKSNSETDDPFFQLIVFIIIILLTLSAYALMKKYEVFNILYFVLEVVFFSICITYFSSYYDYRVDFKNLKKRYLIRICILLTLSSLFINNVVFPSSMATFENQLIQNATSFESAMNYLSSNFWNYETLFLFDKLILLISVPLILIKEIIELTKRKKSIILKIDKPLKSLIAYALFMAIIYAIPFLYEWCYINYIIPNLPKL